MLLLATFAYAADLDAAKKALKLGQDEALAGKQAAAVAAFTEAVRLAPKMREAHLHLGMQLDIGGQPKAARAAYEAAIKVLPNDAELHAELGLTLLILKEFAHARTTLERAVKLDPSVLGWQADLAYATHRAGDSKLALERFRALFAKGYKDPVARQHFGDALAKNGDLADAEAVYSELLALTPGDRDLLYRRATVRQARGNDAGAATDRAAYEAIDKKKAL